MATNGYLVFSVSQGRSRHTLESPVDRYLAPAFFRWARQSHKRLQACPAPLFAALP